MKSFRDSCFLQPWVQGPKLVFQMIDFFKKIVLGKCTISKVTLRGEVWAADKGRNLIICWTQHIYLCSEIKCDCPLILGLNLQPRLPWTITRCPLVLASLSAVPSFILKRDAVWAVSYMVTLLKIFKWVIPWAGQLWVRCYEIESKDFQARVAGGCGTMKLWMGWESHLDRKGRGTCYMMRGVVVRLKVRCCVELRGQWWGSEWKVWT